jgi:hypothetical protein
MSIFISVASAFNLSSLDSRCDIGSRPHCPQPSHVSYMAKGPIGIRCSNMPKPVLELLTLLILDIDCLVSIGDPLLVY